MSHVRCTCTCTCPCACTCPCHVQSNMCMSHVHVHAHAHAHEHVHVHAYVCVPSSKCLEAWRRSPPAAPRRSLQLLAFHAVLTLATYASYSHLRFLLTYAGTAGARLHALPLHVHRLVPRDPRASHGRGAAWAAPQLGSCASLGRARRRLAARYSQGEAGPQGAQPPPRMLELTASPYPKPYPYP